MSERACEYVREPCPICGHRGWCARRDDGLVLCKRPPEPRTVSGYSYMGMAVDGATGMFVEAGREHASWRLPRRSVETQIPCPDTSMPTEMPSPDGRIEPQWLTENYPRLVANLTDERRAALAIALALPVSALSALAVGWWPDRRCWNTDTQQYEGEPGCWTFPECDAHERIIGVGLRFPAGYKGQLAGGRRGLTLPRRWREASDPVLIMEGPSDVLTGCALGLTVIGRPSNNGGAELLAQGCRNRRVIVLGENDRKPDGRWPGKEGAEAVAAKLAASWARPVRVSFPPDELKDLRAWLLAQRADLDCELDAADRVALAAQFLAAVSPAPILLRAEQRSRRAGKIAVRAFRWHDAPDAGPFFTDKLDLDSAKARARFVAALAELEPSANAAVLSDELLRLKVPDGPAPKRAVDRDYVLPSPAPIPPTPSTGGRPRIQGNERQLRDIRTDALQALVASNDPPRLFSRSSGIARIATLHDDREQAAPLIQQLDAHALRGELTDAADWFTLRHLKNGDIAADDLPPLTVAHDILALPAIELPPLTAVITCPAFAGDGSLVVDAGYHPSSGLWHHRTLPDLPEIPEHPTEDDIVAARNMLLEVVAEFPFVDDASRANALALMLLPFVRPLIDSPTPLHAADAPTPGTGKGLLVQACLWPALGFSLDIRSGAREPDEWRKRITSELAAGKPVIGFDNATTRLDSEHLAAALTATLWTDRVLGQTRVVTIPNRSVWVCTGNNLAFSKELARRVVWIRLDAKVEVPEQRTGFRHPNLTAYVRTQRAALVAAALTLCRAWLAAGRPKGSQVMGSFESYAETLGGILDIAGVPGYLANADDLRRQADTETTEWRAFIHVWWERWHDALVGVSDLTELLWVDGQRTDLLPNTVRSESQRGAVTQLGRRLSAKRDCIIGGLRVVVGDKTDHKDRLVYRLVPTSPPSEQSRHEVGSEVGNSNPGDDNDLDENADLCRLAGPSLTYTCGNNARTSDTPASLFFPPHTRSNPNKSAKVGNGTQLIANTQLARADFHADLPPTSGLEPGKSASSPGTVGVPCPATMRWYEGNDVHLPRSVLELAHQRDGWTPSAWRDRLLQLAERCGGSHPERAVELRCAAALLCNVMEKPDAANE